MTQPEKESLMYPPAPKGESVDDYFGTLVADPYRWLEDPDSPQTIAWVKQQNSLTAAYLRSVTSQEEIRSRLNDLWNYPKFTAPQKKGQQIFFSKNDGLQNQAVLYMQDGFEGEPQTLLDPNLLSNDGTIALITQSYSKDGQLLAYGLSSHGSDWQVVHIRAIERGEDYPEQIQWTKFASIAWQSDNKGFYYNRLPEPGSVPEGDENNYSRVYRHTLGSPQSEDKLIFERPDAKELSFIPLMSDDAKYLLLYVAHGTDPRNGIYYRKLEGENDVITLVEDGLARFEPAGNDGLIFYFHTDYKAPNGRLIAIDIQNPDPVNWREIIPEGDDPIVFAALVNDQFIISTSHHVHQRLFIYRKNGSQAHEIELPTLGSILEFHGEQKDTTMFLSFTSFLYPTTNFLYDFEEQQLKAFHKIEMDFDPSLYETRQVFFNSKDGTRVPMFLTHKKGLSLDGDNPTILYGYGGFNINVSPAFNVSKLIWLEQGGVFAVANLRGGNEYGETWHQAGMLEKKQNVFDDFSAAAEWLIQNNYTSTTKLAIEGRSNGGLLVSACMVQRPELFGAVLCHVPVIDMLRYHKFTIGRYWVPEYGNAEEDPEHFRFLYAYSPLHQIVRQTLYPPCLITSADTDDRVVPAHAKKFAATLQAYAAAQNPTLIRIETKAGHGLGKPVSKLIDEQVDIYSFLFKIMGIEFQSSS